MRRLLLLALFAGCQPETAPSTYDAWLEEFAGRDGVLESWPLITRCGQPPFTSSSSSCEALDRDADGYLVGIENACLCAGHGYLPGDCLEGGGPAEDFYPGAPELLDGFDNDCDGLVDEVDSCGA